MGQAVIYLRPGTHRARRDACVAEANERGLAVVVVTYDPAEARRLRREGYALVTPPEQLADLYPDLVVPVRRRTSRRGGALVAAAAPRWRSRSAGYGLGLVQLDLELLSVDVRLCLG